MTWFPYKMHADKHKFAIISADKVRDAGLCSPVMVKTMCFFVVFDNRDRGVNESVETNECITRVNREYGVERILFFFL